MGAKNVVPMTFYKLKKDDKKQSPNFNKLMFFQQVKNQGKWGDGRAVNCLEGYVKNITIDTYMWEGKPTDSLKFEILDNDNLDAIIIFQIGLRSNTAQSIINTLAGEESLGVMRFFCGDPRESKGQMYPTFYVKNDKKDTNWKYSPQKGNFHEIPRTVYQGEGLDRVAMNQEQVDLFWKGVLANDVMHKLYSPPDGNEQDFGNVPNDPGQDMSMSGDNFVPSSGPADDLPF